VAVRPEEHALTVAEPLAYYDHTFFGKYAAIAQNTFGKGTLTYEGTVRSDKLKATCSSRCFRGQD